MWSAGALAARHAPGSSKATKLAARGTPTRSTTAKARRQCVTTSPCRSATRSSLACGSPSTWSTHAATRDSSSGVGGASTDRPCRSASDAVSRAIKAAPTQTRRSARAMPLLRCGSMHEHGGDPPPHARAFQALGSHQHVRIATLHRHGGVNRERGSVAPAPDPNGSVSNARTQTTDHAHHSVGHGVARSMRGHVASSKCSWMRIVQRGSNTEAAGTRRGPEACDSAAFLVITN